MASPEPLFKPFRALGYITDDVPFAIQRRGKETFVTVSVGKAWQIYNTNKLTLSLVGPQLKGDICALAAKGDLTFAATGGTIVVCKRVQKVAEFRAHRGSIRQLMVMANCLFSLGSDNRLTVWRIGHFDAPAVDIAFPAGFTATCFAHPDTYLNKLLVGSAEGKLQLWNFVSQALLFEFAGWASAVKTLAPSPALDVMGIGLADGRAVLHNIKFDETVVIFDNAAGLGASGLGGGMLGATATAAASAGGAGGRAVTTLAFRTGAGLPLMAAGGGAGVVTVWNLEARRLHTVIRDAHDGPLVSLHFFAGEPRLMSAAGDNSVKQWVFDSADSSARLLRFRSGHSAPPACIQYYGEGLRLLSAGQDRAFRVFSTIQDQQSRELSQHHTQRRAKKLKIREEELKLPRVVAMDACDVRERDWCNVITAHDGDSTAYTWRLQHFTLGDQMLRLPPAEIRAGPGESAVTSVAVSRCGNFGLVGTAAGRLDRYNMQSGLHRLAYRRPAAAAAGGGSASAVPTGAAIGAAAHDGAVVGVASDTTNRLLVSGGHDGRLRVWGFKSGRLQSEVNVGAPIAKMCLHAGSGLAAVATDGHAIRMYDIEAARLVRRFAGHGDRITCLQISEDCRWLLSAGMDATVKVWDVPAAQCLQVMRLGAPVTGLSLSPTHEMLATVNAGRRGIYLWSNQMIFGDPSRILPSEKPVSIGMPTVSSGAATGAPFLAADGADGDADAELSVESTSTDYAASDSESDEGGPSGAGTSGDTAASAEKAYEARDASGAPRPLVPQLATLSMLPRTQWENLQHLEAIKARNKPIQPPKKPEAAPFFLPTVPSLARNPVFDTSGVGAGGNGNAAGDDGSAAAAAAAAAVVAGGKPAKSKVAKGSAGAAPALPAFIRLLRSGEESGDYAAFMAHLRGLTPSAIDIEMRAMQVLEGAEGEGEALADVTRLLSALAAEVRAARSFEFCQALLALALSVHGDSILRHAPLRAAAADVKAALTDSWRQLDELLQSTRCMVGFLGNLQA